MKKFFVPVTFVFVILMGLLSCEKEMPLGIWPKMEFKYQNETGNVRVNQKESVITVKTSGTLDIVCTNYSTMWFVEYPDCIPPLENDNKESWKFSNEWCDLTIDGNIIHCVFKSFVVSGPKEVTIWVSVGDTGWRFTFIRE